MTPASPSNDSPLDLIRLDMRAVDLVINDRLTSEVPLVKEVSQYIISAGGKRLRPALLLLVSGALGSDHPHRHTLAAVVEFIDTATLLHDDVVDESTLKSPKKPEGREVEVEVEVEVFEGTLLHEEVKFFRQPDIPARCAAPAVNPGLFLSR